MNHSTADGTRIDRRALVAASITVALWASAFVSIRGVADHFSPGALALGRLLTGSAIMGVLLLVKRVGFPPREAWRGILISGVFWFGAYMVVLNWGEQKVDAGTAAMVVNVGPLVIALLGGWLLREGFPRMLVAGMAVSFAGAIVVGISTSSGGHSSLGGVLLCLLAAVCYGVGVVGQKPALRHASALQVTAFACFTGTIVCLPFAGQLVSQVSRAPLSASWNILYLGAFPTALAFTTWAYALARTTAGKLGATTYAVPALVVVMSWIFLGEVPAWLAVAGGALCLGGVAVSRLGGSASTPAPASVPAPAPRAAGGGPVHGPAAEASSTGSD
ncbi:DMT family transporter [Streptomyces sp. NPDC051016]|uniref:DMT family transporter n=1 Tax=Streptomyces sp. NPDC051016 TaxID=3365638 RepID=UPI0037BD565D